MGKMDGCVATSTVCFTLLKILQLSIITCCVIFVSVQTCKCIAKYNNEVITSNQGKFPVLLRSNSISGLVCLSVRPSVCPSVRPKFLSQILSQISVPNFYQG